MARTETAPLLPAWHTQPLTDRAVAATLIAAILEEARLRALTLEFPPPPQPTACCGRGCNGCVWEGYYTALHWWREDARALLGG